MMTPARERWRHRSLRTRIRLPSRTLTPRSIVGLLALAALCACSNGSAAHPRAEDAGPIGHADAGTLDCGSAFAACDAGCSNGVVTACYVESFPPGSDECAYAVPVTTFCPFGCNHGYGRNLCNSDYPVDGAVCGASSATITAGMLLPHGATGAQAVSAPLATTVRVTVATSLAAACSSSGDAGGVAGAGSGALLTLVVPLNATGTFTAAGVSAQLTVWKDGMVVLEREPATAGSVIVTFQDYSEYSTYHGTVGSYDVTFGSDVERGSFIAPVCDGCPASP